MGNTLRTTREPSFAAHLRRGKPKPPVSGAHGAPKAGVARGYWAGVQDYRRLSGYKSGIGICSLIFGLPRLFPFGAHYLYHVECKKADLDTA